MISMHEFSEAKKSLGLSFSKSKRHKFCPMLIICLAFSTVDGFNRYLANIIADVVVDENVF